MLDSPHHYDRNLENRSFFREVPDSKIVCLMFHDLGTSPASFLSLSQSLEREKISSYCPILPGHGESLSVWEDLNENDWLEAALTSYDYLQKQYPHIVLVGLGMGGNLALAVASQRKASALVLYSTPYVAKKFAYLWEDDEEETIDTISWTLHCSRHEGRQRLRHHTHLVLPVRALKAWYALSSYSASQLKRLTMPSLIVHARKDRAFPDDHAQKISQKIASHHKKVVWLKRSFHQLLDDYSYHQVKKHTVQFIKENLQHKKVFNLPNF